MEPWAGGPGVEPCSQDTLPEFSSTTRGRGISLFHVCTPPTSLDGCDYFNSVVVRLPFRSIPDFPEWWLFYILLVILLWLCKEASHVCLCHHLDRKINWIFYALAQITLLLVGSVGRYFEARFSPIYISSASSQEGKPAPWFSWKMMTSPIRLFLSGGTPQLLNSSIVIITDSYLVHSLQKAF